MTRSIDLGRVRFSKKYLLLSSVYLSSIAGIITGAIMRNNISLTSEISVLGLFSDFLQVDFTRSKFSAFMMGATINFIFFLLVFVFGLSVCGGFFIYILNYFKGLGIGFTVGIICKTFGAKGIIISLLSVFPQSVLFIICLAYFSTEALRSSFTLVNIFTKGNLYKKEIPLPGQILKKGMYLFSITLAGVLYEVFLARFFMMILL